MPLYRALSKSYNKTFTQGIHAFYNAALKNSKNNNETYCAFYPSFGVKESTRPVFLVYGQAVLGWHPEFTINAKNPVSLHAETCYNYANDYFETGNHNPLEWVNVYWSKAAYNSYEHTSAFKSYYPPMRYSTSRSFFWNVVYKLINTYNNKPIDSLEWTQYVVWSNLYKITANNRNPTYEECLWQQENATVLVQQELEEIKPDYCIILTNDSWWKPFRDHLRTTQKGVNNIIQSVETFNKTRLIVTTRPYAGSSNAHVQEVLQVLR